MRNLPAGEYLLAAVTDVEQGEWFDPPFLGTLVGASIPVTLGDGEKKAQDVRIKGVPCQRRALATAPAFALKYHPAVGLECHVH